LFVFENITKKEEKTLIAPIGFEAVMDRFGSLCLKISALLTEPANFIGI